MTDDDDDFDSRDAFAVIALNGLLSGGIMPPRSGIHEAAEAAYAYADAMLEARKRTQD